jgi:hypothetical protein
VLLQSSSSQNHYFSNFVPGILESQNFTQHTDHLHTPHTGNVRRLFVILSYKSDDLKDGESTTFKYDNKMCLVCKTWFCLDLASASPGYFVLTSLWKLLQRASCIHTTNRTFQINSPEMEMAKFHVQSSVQKNK